jgi:hypothetical protein
MRHWITILLFFALGFGITYTILFTLSALIGSMQSIQSEASKTNVKEFIENIKE